MANEARDKSLDILKSIGIITMVFGHSNMGETFTTYIAGFHMQLFFLISGYLFTPNKYDFKSFLLRKAKTLLVPYCTFCILTLVVVLSINQISGTEVYDINCALKGIIYSNRSLFPITGAIWFLQCMFFAEIVFFLIVTYIKKIWNNYFRMWIIVIVIYLQRV